MQRSREAEEDVEDCNITTSYCVTCRRAPESQLCDWRPLHSEMHTRRYTTKLVFRTSTVRERAISCSALYSTRNMYCRRHASEGNKRARPYTRRHRNPHGAIELARNRTYCLVSPSKLETTNYSKDNNEDASAEARRGYTSRPLACTTAEHKEEHWMKMR